MTPHAWVFGIMAFFGLKAAGWLPFQNEIQQALAYTIPFIPYLILAFILRGVIGDAIGGVKNGINKLYTLIASIVYGFIFTGVVVPTMLADSFLLGPIAMWAWKYQAIQILSIVVNGFVYWFLTQTPTVIPKKIIVGALIASCTFVFGGYFSQFVFNTHWLEFTARNGVFMPDPAASISLKEGDTIHFVALGYSVERTRFGGTVTNQTYPPEGAQTDLIHDGVNAWPRPRGEIQFLVRRPIGPSTIVYVQDVTSGPLDILLWSFKYLVGGYYVSGTATVPKGVAPGRLGVEFLDIAPVEGYIKLTLVHNLGSSLIGRFTQSFVLGEGRKVFTKKDFESGVWLLALGFAAFTLIGGVLVFGRTKEGLLPHIPGIIVAVICVFIVWYVVDWLSFTGRGGPFTLLKNVWGWIKS